MAETMTVRIRNLQGHLREVELTDNGRFATPGSALEQQLVTTATGSVLIRKFVPRAAGRARPYLYDCLDREIQAGARLGQMYGGTCPPELPDLVAYDMDAEEPFAVLRPYEGDPVVEGMLNRLAAAEDAAERFRRSLLRALDLTGRAGVVHGQVDLRHLRWNGEHVQLVDFEAARCAPLRRSNGARPGGVDVREDLPPAGMILRRLAMGTTAAGSPADHTRDPDHLRALLEGVFDAVDRRPYPFELLRRLGDDTPSPRTADPEAGLHNGWRLFDRLTAPQTVPPPAPKQRWRRPVVRNDGVDRARRGAGELVTHTPSPAELRCPICADEVAWRTDEQVYGYVEAQSNYERVDVSSMSEPRLSATLRESYRKCPNPSGDMPEHYLPATYFDYGDPLVVGLVGAPAAGKTHLLTAMIWAAYQHALQPYGIETAALDFRRHREFERLYVRPFQDGGELAGTRTGVMEAADILLLRGPGGERPVTFFDVAGEDLESTTLNRATRFLTSATAVIFVHGLEDSPQVGGPARSNSSWAFELAVERLRGMPGGADRIPAALAVTKADRLRYVPPIDHWLRRDTPRSLDPATMREQTRDVYAHLQHTGQTGALRPFEAFRRCTMHFVSASGKDAVPVDPAADRLDRCFPRGISPMHVLEPFVSILAMTGMLPGAEADQAGAA